MKLLLYSGHINLLICQCIYYIDFKKFIFSFLINYAATRTRSKLVISSVILTL